MARGEQRGDPEHRSDVRLRGRFVFLSTVEEAFRRQVGRNLTAKELEVALRAYRGDVEPGARRRG